MLLHVPTRWRLTFFLRFQSHPAADFESSNYVINYVIEAPLQCYTNSFKMWSSGWMWLFEGCSWGAGAPFFCDVKWPGKRKRRAALNALWPRDMVRLAFPMVLCWRGVLLLQNVATRTVVLESGDFCYCCDWVEWCGSRAFTWAKKSSRPLDSFSVTRIDTWSMKPPLDRSTFRIMFPKQHIDFASGTDVSQCHPFTCRRLLDVALLQHLCFLAIICTGVVLCSYISVCSFQMTSCNVPYHPQMRSWLLEFLTGLRLETLQTTNHTLERWIPEATGLEASVWGIHRSSHPMVCSSQVGSTRNRALMSCLGVLPPKPPIMDLR